MGRLLRTLGMIDWYVLTTNSRVGGFESCVMLYLSLVERILDEVRLAFHDLGRRTFLADIHVE